MKTIKIEIDGEMTEANVYESMWEYVSEWDITHYAATLADDAPEKFAEPFRPIDDVDLSVMNEGIVVDGKRYDHLNGGESATSLIPSEDRNDEFWTIFEKNLRREGEWNSTGQIFESREEAEKEVA